MDWEIEYTDEFSGWWAGLEGSTQDDIASVVGLLEKRGPSLDHPYSSAINGSKHSHMRELRIQSGGKPVRVFYAFDSRRAAILLIGGDKTGDKRFYEKFVPIVDRLYDEHLDMLKKEGYL
ncbi:MAG: type II toxin-antitoxin system RelE/ParE family toxin [Pseudomonadota bacterium]